jgi:hypothetical protein
MLFHNVQPFIFHLFPAGLTSDAIDVNVNSATERTRTVVVTREEIGVQKGRILAVVTD